MMHLSSSAPSNSSCSSGSKLNQISTQSYKIITQYGDMLVIKQGIHLHHHHHHHHPHPHPHQPHQQHQSQEQQQQQQQRPIIMTFHDLGLNSELQFATFCESDEVKLMLQTFTMIHVNFVGQEFSQSSTDSPERNQQQQHHQHQQQPCNNLPDDFKYPSVEQMAECIVDICTQLRIRSFIALAVGAGAYIAGSLALMRSDLVDGLFLINPVTTSCSITEWLYFKMSAIASNNNIGNWSSGESAHYNNNNTQPEPNQKEQHNSSLRKFFNAAQVHLPHIHHNNNNNENKEPNNSKQLSGSSLQEGEQDLDSENEPSKLTAHSAPGSLHQPQHHIKPHSSPSSSGGGGGRGGGGGGSRLRQLIFSRNFRNQQQQQQHQHETATKTSPSSSSPSPKSKASGSEEEKASSGGGGGGKNSDEHRKAAESQKSDAKRHPFEYLMYHHFGPASFQRYRRSSDTPARAAGDSPISTRRQVGGGSGSQAAAASASCLGSSDSNNSSPASGSSRSAIRRFAGRHRSSCSRSQDSLEKSTKGVGVCSSERRVRSGSFCMSANYLASFSSERQRAAYMQSVYKQYFTQINVHNLWLFAQSFVKRKNLNLRKDCGAAAHAAAAAATLGTSICTAFVGIAGPGSSSGSYSTAGNQPSATRQSSRKATDTPTPTSSGADGSAAEEKKKKEEEEAKIMGSELAVENSSHGTPTESSAGRRRRRTRSEKKDVEVSALKGAIKSSPMSASAKAAAAAAPHKKQQQQQVLVAGTKVKRTFTCQTLIMCSSVQMHCERAFKLMSLLNPLQATWIKTEQLLVLEERPDKVCQALRLFLQGIGYSMSTYERRLRLSSGTGSVSSADSSGSTRELN